MGLFGGSEEENDGGFLSSVKGGIEEGRKIPKIQKYGGTELWNQYRDGNYDSPEQFVREETEFDSWDAFVSQRDDDSDGTGDWEESEGDGADQEVNESEASANSDHLDCEPQGEWVNADRVAKVTSLLDEGESVHYMWRGGTIDVEGSGAGESIFGNDRDRKSSIKGIFTAVTDTRIVISIPQVLGDDERHIPYRSVTSVDLDTGLMARRVSIQTKGQTYHIQAQGPSKDELRDAMKFVREQIEAVNQPRQVESEPDPTEQLKNLKELHDQGVLSDEEFEAKKSDLLDKI